MTKQEAIDHFNMLVQQGATPNELKEAEAAITRLEQQHPTLGNGGQNHD